MVKLVIKMTYNENEKLPDIEYEFISHHFCIFVIFYLFRVLMVTYYKDIFNMLFYLQFYLNINLFMMELF